MPWPAQTGAKKELWRKGLCTSLKRRCLESTPQGGSTTGPTHPKGVETMITFRKRVNGDTCVTDTNTEGTTMRTTTFAMHLMLATDDDLRSEIADDTLSFSAHMALVHALHSRESARLAADQLAHDHVVWAEVSTKIAFIDSDDTPSAAWTPDFED